MEMKLGFKQEQLQTQRQTQQFSQQQLFEQYFKIEQQLKHEPIPKAVKGLEGIQKANEILKKYNVAGILIGGLAEALYNNSYNENKLYNHKDVDVLVLDKVEIENFEGGIDWWLLKETQIKEFLSCATIINTIKYYENGFGVVLPFTIKSNKKINPGLYFPDSQLVTNMKKAVMPIIKYKIKNMHSKEAVELGPEKFKNIEKTIEKKYKTENKQLIQYLEKKGISLIDSSHLEFKKIDLENLLRLLCENLK